MPRVDSVEAVKDLNLDLERSAQPIAGPDDLPFSALAL
jgi:hypothetical protein